MEKMKNNKQLEILDQSSSGNDNDSFDENDNKYTDPEEEVDDNDQQNNNDNDEDDDSQQIDTSTAMSSQRRQYKGNFSTSQQEEEFGCPYAACGRKFVSADMMKQHIERRHAPVISPKKPQQISRDKINMHAAQPITKGTGEIQPKRFQEDKLNQTKFGFFQAAPRPVTSHGRQNPQVSQQQAQILRDMMGGSSHQHSRRPQTAATTTKKDEQRIKKKILALEAIERKIEDDIDEFNNRKKAKQVSGVRVTKAMLLEASQCDELSEIQAIILREKNIEIFDDNKKDGFKIEDLVNCEAIYATHNLIRDIFGICQISTLVELNLSFNQISDIQPLEDLTLLQKLWLNRNNILVIDPIKSLTKLEVLGLFNNEIFNDKKTLEILTNLQNLKELSIDGNPVSSQVKFKYEIIMRLRKLEVLDDDPVKELDRDVAEQFFIQNKMPLPGSGIIKKSTISSVQQQQQQFANNQQENIDYNQQADDNALKENNQMQSQQQLPGLKIKKSVKFSKASVDDDGNTWQSDEIKKLEAKCAELIVENEEYKVKLQQRHYDQVYKENDRLKMELKNMYILEEENKDLREELEQLKSLTYEDKVRQLVDENYNLKKRNGMLLIQVSELEQKIEQLSRSKQDELLDFQKNMRDNITTMARPSTSAGAFMRKKDDMSMVDADFLALQETAQDDFDKELDQLIMKSQKNLAEMQNDVKEISKIVGEPIVNVRKIKQVRTVKAQNQVLNMKPQQSSDRVKALGADMVDDNI